MKLFPPLFDEVRIIIPRMAA